MWDAAKAHFGRIDIWINNAGVGHPQAEFRSQSAAQVDAVVNTNLVGAMYGSIVALRGVREQGWLDLKNKLAAAGFEPAD